MLEEHERPWRLTIEKENGQIVYICGDEALLRSELSAWVEHENTSAEEYIESEESGQTYRNAEAHKVRQIEGCMDDANRSPVVLAYRFIDVLGMCLLEM